MAPSITAPISRKQKKRGFPVVAIVLCAIVISGSILVFLVFQMRASVQDSNERHSKQAVSSSSLSAKDTARAMMRHSQAVPEIKPPPGTVPKSAYGGTLVIKTEIGNIRVVLRPDLSESSCKYIHQVVKLGFCNPCNIYRADKPGILQGVMKTSPEAMTAYKPSLGECPKELVGSEQDCPPWDPKCACHGPTMTKGMVAWAGGGTGPDFFIDTYPKPAKFWGQQHTVFGQVQDDTSFAVINEIYDRPTTKSGIMVYLVKPIHYDLSIE